MVVSRLAIEGGLKTYDRQERIARADKKRSDARKVASRDQLSLSPVAKKITTVNELAAKLVDSNTTELEPEERRRLLKEETTRLLYTHKDDIESQMSPEAFAAKLQSTTEEEPA
jgi:hypothetical protein